VRDSTSEEMKDDVISNTQEENAKGISGDETHQKGDGNVINTEGQEAGHGSELEDTDEYSEITTTKNDGNNDHSLPDNDDKTEHDGNVESEGKADSSSTELNQGSLANSEQGIDDVDQKSSDSTEAPDSEIVGGVHENSDLPDSEIPVTHLEVEDDNNEEGNANNDDNDGESDAGTVARYIFDDVSDSAEPANEEGSTGDQSASDAEHAAEAHENFEGVATEVNDNDNTEHDISQGDDSDTETLDDTHHAVGPSSEDGVENQNNSAEENNSGVPESSTQGTKEEHDDDDHDIPDEGDSNIDTPDDVHQDTSSDVGTDDQNLSVESSSQIGGSNITPTTEINAQNFHQGPRSFNPLPPFSSSDSITSNDDTSTNFNYSTKNTDVPATTEISQTADNQSNIAANANENLGEDEDRQSGTLAENVVTPSVPGSENKTLFGTRVQKGDIKQGGNDDGINEPGIGSHQRDSDSSGSIGSYIVLGVIMAIIVMLLGYSVIRGRGRRTQGSKSEDFGTELAEVKKNLLPQNEFKGEIQPRTRLEEDESKAKLLPDAQRTGDNVQNGDAGVAVQNGVDSQKEPGEIEDRPTEKKFDLNTIAAQLEPIDSSQTNLNSQNQNSTNPFREAITPKKQETADDQSTHHQSLNTPTHQKAYNNVNGVPEVVVERVPVQTYGGYVTQNSGVPAVHSGLQQQNMGIVHPSGPPIKVVTVVEEVCVPTMPVIVNMERNIFQH